MAAGWPPAIVLLLLLAPFLLSATVSSMVLPLAGNVYPVGQFYVAVGIGEPAKPYFLHIDTGSSFTWVECDAGGGSCNKCNTGKDMSTLPVKKWVPMAPGQLRYSPGRARLHLDTTSIGGADPVEVILDSGSTYTYLPSALHKQLVAALQATLGKSLQVVKDPSLPLCWKRPEKFKSVDDLKKEFKAVMSFNFGNDVTMVIPPENYLAVTQQGNACFGILDYNAKYIILGDITMQGLFVVYDNDRKQLGWMRAIVTSRPSPYLRSFRASEKKFAVTSREWVDWSIDEGLARRALRNNNNNKGM